MVFTMPLETASEPQPGLNEEIYYVITVNGREVRPLNEALLQQERQDAYNAWLQEQKDEKAEYLDWEDVTPDEP